MLDNFVLDDEAYRLILYRSYDIKSVDRLHRREQNYLALKFTKRTNVFILPNHTMPILGLHNLGIPHQ